MFFGNFFGNIADKCIGDRVNPKASRASRILLTFSNMVGKYGFLAGIFFLHFRLKDVNVARGFPKILVDV